MQDNFLNCLNKFTLLPDNDGQPFHVDSGGPTSYGVTRANWSRWIKHPASDDEMRSLSAAAVVPLYEAWYWNTIKGDALPIGVDLMVFDHGVMSGEHTSVQQLQQVLRVDQDGWVGEQTIAAASAHPPAVIVGMLAWRQEEYYRSLAAFSINGNGWLARLDRRVAMAIRLIGK